MTMPTSPSSSASSSSVNGAGQPPTASEPNTDIDTKKTIGLDNPEAHRAAAKPLQGYYISSFYEDENGILTVETDDRSLIDKNKNVQAVRLFHCLFLVHVPDKGEQYVAWHITGADLHCLINRASRDSGADAKADDWKKSVQDNPGTTYLCGPEADDLARDFFNVNPENVHQTEKGPVSVLFNIATRSFKRIA